MSGEEENDVDSSAEDNETKRESTYLKLKLTKGSDTITEAEIPPDNESIRDSIGVQALFPLEIDGVRHWALLFNKKRLAKEGKKRTAVVGPVGGGAGWKGANKDEQWSVRRDLQEKFDLSDDQFSDDPEDEVDFRIEGLPLDTSEALINHVVEEELIDFEAQAMKEVEEELGGEMVDLVKHSGGAIQAENYDGPLPARGEYKPLEPYIDPVKESGRQARVVEKLGMKKREKSLRIQYRFIVEPGEELRDYIIKNGKTFKDSVKDGFIDKPMMLLDDEDVQEMIDVMANAKSEKETIMPGIKLGEEEDALPVYIGGLINVFKDQV